MTAKTKVYGLHFIFANFIYISKNLIDTSGLLLPFEAAFCYDLFWINHNFLYFSSDSYMSMTYWFILIWTPSVLHDSANIEIRILFIALFGQFPQLLLPWHSWSAYFPRPSGFCLSRDLCGTNVPLNGWSIKPVESSETWVDVDHLVLLWMFSLSGLLFEGKC